MPVRPDRVEEHGRDYRIRVLSCVLVAQIVLIVAVRWWPLSEAAPDTNIYHTKGQEVIAIEEVVQTRQQQKPPPPPPPLIPIVVPDDVVLDDQVEVDENLLTLDEYADALLDEALMPPAYNTSSFKAPEMGPKPLRFVEPEYTRAARRKNVRAEIIVEVLVDEKGLVRDARILERFLYNNDNNEKEVVNGIEYGLEESALSAAQRWMFQPAKQNGQPVQSYTTLTFSFGV